MTIATDSNDVENKKTNCDTKKSHVTDTCLTYAYMSDWKGVLNKMKTVFGLTGKFTSYTENINEADPSKDIVIYARDKYDTGIADHFLSSIGNDKVYDPQTREIYNLSDVKLQQSRKVRAFKYEE